MADTIRRAPHNTENPFAQISRAMLQDKTLSYEARGLLAYLLSKPGTWEVRVFDVQIPGCGRDKVYRLLDELRRRGYIGGHSKYQDEKGHWKWTPYDVYETPQASPLPENPYTGEPYTENTEIKDIKKRKKEKKESAASIEARAQTESSSVKAEENGTDPSEASAKASEARPRSPKQIEQTAAAEALAAALGITLASPDYGLYIKHAGILVKAGITSAEFARYVKRIQRIANGTWTVTVSSLTAGGRISEYITARDAYRKQQESGDASGVWTGETAAVSYHETYVPPTTSTALSEEERAAQLQSVQAGLEALRSKKAQVLS